MPVFQWNIANDDRQQKTWKKIIFSWSSSLLENSIPLFLKKIYMEHLNQVKTLHLDIFWFSNEVVFTVFCNLYCILSSFTNQEHQLKHKTKNFEFHRYDCFKNNNIC